MPRVAPDTEDACALVVRTAAAAGWQIRIEGSGTWASPDAPADLAITTKQLNRLLQVDPSDQVATAQAGIRWEDLRSGLADRGTWLSADPPGRGRTLGSVVATGTAGPLRSGFGALRDHIVGLSFVTGEGQIVRAGGKVVKNVAGFDLAKLAAGSFGVFGIITSLSMRLGTIPRADSTLLTQGARDALARAALRVLDAGESPAALELLSPGAAGGREWVLALRLVGSGAAVEASRQRIPSLTGVGFAELSAPDSGDFWSDVSAGATRAPVTLRLGVLPTSVDVGLDLLAHHLDEGWISVSVAAGTIRWSGSAEIDRLRLLRRVAAQREFPVSVERAPHTVLASIGHFGAYRENAGRLVGALRSVFDPRGVFSPRDPPTSDQ